MEWCDSLNNVYNIYVTGHMIINKYTVYSASWKAMMRMALRVIIAIGHQAISSLNIENESFTLNTY